MREPIEALSADDLAARAHRLARHRIMLGADRDGHDLGIEPHGSNLLLTGTSGSGKSTVARGLLERIAEHGYSYCVIDPEGDYEGQPGAVSTGTPERAPGLDETMQLLAARDARPWGRSVALSVHHGSGTS